ncbi:MAG TPA: Holliday junction resolvase RuvX [Acidimicrobiales bacterium]|nr:Holliday junction resolvase RuvX [Acidimicrobiales bacterium]
MSGGAKGRVVGLDLGTKRIGVAVTDPTKTLASPYEVIARSPDAYARIARIVEETEAERVVVGLPLSMSGQAGAAAQSAQAEADALAELLPVPVELWDERLTTVTADRGMMELRMKADARRRVVDKVAAAVLLQSWLEARP